MVHGLFRAYLSWGGGFNKEIVIVITEIIKIHTVCVLTIVTERPMFKSASHEIVETSRREITQFYIM